tara:strand:+ start:426 stop:620 length:195 start_codon:yes stop_codon:yes gene_type:complete
MSFDFLNNYAILSLLLKKRTFYYLSEKDVCSNSFSSIFSCIAPNLDDIPIYSKGISPLATTLGL